MIILRWKTVILISVSHQTGFYSTSLYNGDLEKGKMVHEPRLVLCWSMLVIGSLGAMWTILTFAKYPGMKSGSLAGHWFTWPEGPVQCEPMLGIVWPPGTYAKWVDAWPEQQINAMSFGSLLKRGVTHTKPPFDETSNIFDKIHIRNTRRLLHK